MTAAVEPIFLQPIAIVLVALFDRRAVVAVQFTIYPVFLSEDVIIVRIIFNDSRPIVAMQPPVPPVFIAAISIPIGPYNGRAAILMQLTFVSVFHKSH